MLKVDTVVPGTVPVRARFVLHKACILPSLPVCFPRHSVRPNSPLHPARGPDPLPGVRGHGLASWFGPEVDVAYPDTGFTADGIRLAGQPLDPSQEEPLRVVTQFVIDAEAAADASPPLAFFPLVGLQFRLQSADVWTRLAAWGDVHGCHR